MKLLTAVGRPISSDGEFPFGPGGYYAFYFRGPDRLKFEVVHMPAARARAFRSPAAVVKPPQTSPTRRAKSIVVRSSRYGPTICKPTGSPSRVRPTGATLAGQLAERRGRDPANRSV